MKHQKPLIIALVGNPGAGKDAVANVLQMQLGFARLAFADALRSEVVRAWRIDWRMLTERHSKEQPRRGLAAGMCDEVAFMQWVASGGESLLEARSARWVMQHWGTFKSQFIPDYWARTVERWVGRQIECGVRRIVVTDLRFPNEEAMLRRLGAAVVRVHRPNLAALPADTALHASEQHHHRIHADADIVNDTSLQALAEAAVRCVYALSEGATA